MRPRLFLRLWIAVALALPSLTVTLAHADAPDYVWIEGEVPMSVDPPGLLPTIDQGPPTIFSGGKALKFAVEPDQLDAQIPDGGVTLTYDAQVSRAADHDVWIHVAFEQARCVFDWRIDQGNWQTVDPATPTVDVQEVGVWQPYAWLQLGRQALPAGPHTFQIRLHKVRDANGKPQRFLFGCDAICLTSGFFHPDGSIKPGDTSWQTDADKAAAAQEFAIAIPSGLEQSATALNGLWQYAGDDELLVDDRLGPTRTIPDPATLTWHAFPVPGERNGRLPEETYVHRYYLRTRLRIPRELADHSFVLHIPAVSMIATIFVNGLSCGWTKAPWATWDCDLTGAIKPGEVNEICLAFKDSFYGLASDDMVKHPRYTPYPFWHFGLVQALDMPVLGRYETGFVMGEPSLIVGGKIYASDVFALPSLQQKSLGLEITLHNSGATPANVHVTNEIEPRAGGPVEKTFAAQEVDVPAGRDTVVKITEPWANPRLWWPDDPQLYNVVTRLSLDGKPIDERRTKFGFREWTWDGPDFKLNGIPWHGYADNTPGDIAALKARGQFMVRLWTHDARSESQLDQDDAEGMNVRRTGIFDGEGVAGLYDLKRGDLWDNYRVQLAAWVRGQRNHPSIFIWSLENEISFINGHVFGQDEITTREMNKTAQMVQQIDPTRPVMADGGNAELDQALPVYGGHYMEPAFNTYPEGAYDRAAMAHRQVWPITEVKPILLGEAAFVAGESNADHATIGGEQAFLGRADAMPAVAMELRMLSEGYRWNDINFHFWAENQLPIYFKAWPPVAALCRQWDWTFGSGQKVTRTLGIFNNTRHDDPITLDWNLMINGQKIASDSSVHRVAAGGEEKLDVTLTLPTVTTRTEGTWTYALSRNGQSVFEDAKNVSILPPATLSQAPAPGRVAVYDPNGGTKDFFTRCHLAFTPLTDLAQIPDPAKVLVIGADALETFSSSSSQLAAWASQGTGRAVVVLEQKNPLKFQALPGEMATETNAGCLGFPEDLANPIFAGLKAQDFLCWGADDFLYRNAYVKPVSGGKSLLQCDTHLADTALVQMQAGPGILLLSQLLIGEKLATNATAQQLLLNLVRYADGYQLDFLPATVVASANVPLSKAVDAIGLKYTASTDPLAAIARTGSIAIVDASSANLHTLAAHLAQVRAFTSGGGWLILNNLTPEGLADYNTLVGVSHIIRPFRKEKVTWPPERNPLTADLSPGDIVIGSGQQIAPYHAGDYPDPDAYGYVVDLDDAAPFATSPFYAWNNITNSYTMADGEWRLIINLLAGAATVPISLARREQILQFTWTSDLNYEGTTKIELQINGKSYDFATVPDGNPQTFDLPDQPTATNLILKVTDWQHDPHKAQGGQEIVGIDNIAIRVARPADFAKLVRPMLNIGAMVEYPQGAGGIVLCNVKFKETEQNPVNVGKKQQILSALLHNLKAPFALGKTIIAGGNLHFDPIDISRQANQFRGDQGWFGDKQHTFDALPTGKQVMAGVAYYIYHFTTSIVPEAIMLGSWGVPGNLPDQVSGIPVHRKADALFFLQAARIDQKRNPDEVQKKIPCEIGAYVIHYADGPDVRVPINAEIDVDAYQQPTPAAIPGAQIAWAGAYPDKSCAVAYSQQWNNPRPEAEITSIDLVAGAQKERGVPALLALTAATVQK